jgi:serine/threonine protein kinase
MPQLREAALHLVKALLLLHNHDVIHADLKPENVLLAGNGPSLGGGGGGAAAAATGGGGGWGQQVRLTDLGNAIKSREVKLYKEDYEIQTLGYRAPEVLLGGCGGQAFDHQIDMWSLGVLLVELYLGRHLFRAASKVLMLKRILSVLGPLPAREYVSGKFYTAFFGSDHRLRPETFGLRDDPTHAATALIDPRKVQNSFVYDGDVHYRLVCDLLRSREPDFIGFVCGLLQFDPRVRLTAFQALMHPFLAPCFPFSLLRPFLSVGSLGMLEEGRRPMASLPPGSSRTRMVSSSSSSSSESLASASSSPSSSSSFAPARGQQQRVQLKEEEEEEEEEKEEEEEEEEGDGLVAIVESSPSSPSSFGRRTKAEEEEEEREKAAAAAAAAAVLDSHRINQQQNGERERECILPVAVAPSSPALSPDTTSALSLEDPSSPPPLPLETQAVEGDVVLLDEEEEEEEEEEVAVVRKEKKSNGIGKLVAEQTKATKQSAAADAVAFDAAATPPPSSSSSSSSSKKRPRGSTGGSDSGGSSGSSGGRGGAGGKGGSLVKRKEEGKLSGSGSKKGITPIKASGSSLGQTPVRKWYEEVAAEEEEEEEDDEEEARPAPASVGKRKAPPAKQQHKKKEEEEEDSAGEDELIL